MFKRIFDYDRPSRLFAKGDIKYVILNLLKDKPSYGYEIMHSLEEQFHGFYTPSAGSVYPTLQMLEDMGYVNSSERDGKKVYTITEEGKSFLDERKDTVSRIKSHMRFFHEDSNREELHSTFSEFGRMMRLIGRKMRRLDTAKLKRIKDIMAEAHRNVENIIDEE